MVLSGYQGWFATPRNPILRRWSHWSRAGEPRPGSTAFELYPDVREYPVDAMARTGYASLGQGDVSRLFDSDHERVVNLHVRWMQDYGLNGVALQRFVVGIEGERGAWRNSVASRLKGASERLGRTFYIMYDISGHDGQDLAERILDDYRHTIDGDLKLPDSNRYARQDDRPVVAIWGFGFNKRNGTPADAERVIQELRERHGCYVVGGVPYEWRRDETPDAKRWLQVYKRFDMVLPWAVGRYRDPAQVAEHAETIWAADKAFADAEGIDLKRVIFPGFAWSNLKSNQRSAPERALSRHVADARFAPQNEIPRLAGEFFWAQAYHVAKLETTAFIAMFDEFDEATAIAKAAEGRRAIPTDQYFLTLDADGVRVSSDFYLRLAGEATRMIEGRRPITDQVPIDTVPDPDAAARNTQITHGYRGILGRDADAGGRATYLRHFASGGSTLEFCEALANSAEFQKNRSAIEVEVWPDELYRGILEREPDPVGRQRTENEVRNGRLAERAAAMLESTEFRARFLGFT